MDIEIRPIAPEEFEEFVRANESAFGEQPTPAKRIGGIPVFCVYAHRTPNIHDNDRDAQAEGLGGPRVGAGRVQGRQGVQGVGPVAHRTAQRRPGARCNVETN